MEHLKLRLGAKIAALLHLLLILVGLAIVITKASLRLHAQYTEQAEAERGTGFQINFGGLQVQAPSPAQSNWLSQVTDSVAKSRVTRSAKKGDKTPLKTTKPPTKNIRKPSFGVGFGPGRETATEESARTTTIWVLWLLIVLWIIGTGVELWATIMMLISTNPNTERTDCLLKCKVWLIVTPIVSILGIVTFALATEYVFLGTHIVLRAIVLVVVCLYMLEVKSHDTSKQSAEMDTIIYDKSVHAGEK